MNGDELKDMDSGSYNPDTHVSAWCILYTLALRFHLDTLAEECQKNYTKCRRPHWQGCFFPLRSELDYLYEAALPRGSLDFLVQYMIGLISAESLSISSEQLSKVLGHDAFRLDWIRAFRTHRSMDATSPGCLIEDCPWHPTWMQMNRKYVYLPARQ